MTDLKYKLYGRFNEFVRRRLKRKYAKKDYSFLYAYDKSDIEVFRGVDCAINGQKQTAENFDRLFFKGGNVVVLGKNAPKIFKSGDACAMRLTLPKDASPREKWFACIENARVEEGWRNSGLFLCAYIKERKHWALSNWIWTSAAIARALSALGKKEDAKKVADAFLREQLPDGEWVVRYSFYDGNLIRLTAPNDSAYVARNAMTTVYRDTNDPKYLESAKRCADWVMKTAFDDGLVPFAYDIDLERWITDRNIVDMGFTADLFAELYRLTGNETYKAFLEKFIKVYIATFYDRKEKFFASSIGADRKRRGGYFSRGQGWAMEGLCAAYEILRDQEIFQIMEEVTNSIVDAQLANGGWSCNFQKARALMGEDCKGIPVIAKSLLVWAEHSKQKNRFIDSVKKAYDWCVNHTDPETGAIVSFSTNGAIEHSPNASVGFLYANAYAIEVETRLKELGRL